MRINNKEDGFYSILGPVFGSRAIQRVAGDRFYDDDGKDWIISMDSSGNVISVVSILNHIIKNIYTVDADETIHQLKKLYDEVARGKVPVLYRNLYSAAGYQLREDGKNYMTIVGGYHE